MVRNRTDDDSVTYWFPRKHPMARRRGLEFGVFDQTPPKTGSSAQPCGHCRSIFFPRQNYHSQSIGSALRASPFASFAAFARKHNPNVGSALRASPLERCKCTRRQFFALSMSASRSRTCCARLRPRWVFCWDWLKCVMVQICRNWLTKQRTIQLNKRTSFMRFTRDSIWTTLNFTAAAEMMLWMLSMTTVVSPFYKFTNKQQIISTIRQHHAVILLLAVST